MEFHTAECLDPRFFRRDKKTGPGKVEHPKLCLGLKEIGGLFCEQGDCNQGMIRGGFEFICGNFLNMW